jgi:hypothetical protein
MLPLPVGDRPNGDGRRKGAQMSPNSIRFASKQSLTPRRKGGLLQALMLKTGVALLTLCISILVESQLASAEYPINSARAEVSYRLGVKHQRCRTVCLDRLCLDRGRSCHRSLLGAQTANRRSKRSTSQTTTKRPVAERSAHAAPETYLSTVGTLIKASPTRTPGPVVC